MKIKNSFKPRDEVSTDLVYSYINLSWYDRSNDGRKVEWKAGGAWCGAQNRGKVCLPRRQTLPEEMGLRGKQGWTDGRHFQGRKLWRHLAGRYFVWAFEKGN